MGALGLAKCGLMINLHHASCLDWLADYDGPLFDACVTDPPYEIGFMGKKWDNTGVAFRPETWRAVYDALKPGAHLVAFSGCRTYHRMACAIEDAGFEIRDQLFWHYASGFPKSHNVSKGIDRAAGAERTNVLRSEKNFGASKAEDGKNTFGDYAGAWDVTAPATPEAAKWEGWGSALKPSTEPICLARKPLSEKSIAANVLKHGTGALNIDATRVGTEDKLETGRNGRNATTWKQASELNDRPPEFQSLGRWPANLLWSVPCDEYELREDIAPAKRREVMEWLYANS